MLEMGFLGPELTLGISTSTRPALCLGSLSVNTTITIESHTKIERGETLSEGPRLSSVEVSKGDFFMNWFVYILRCCDNSLYVGITNDVKKRLETHNSGKGSKYIRSKLPVKLVYQEEYPDKSTARLREIQLKKWTKHKKELLVVGKLF